MRIDSDMDLPFPKSAAAQKELERFRDEIRKQIERIKTIALTIIIWGPSLESMSAAAQKRKDIRDYLYAEGHNALFSEEISGESCFEGLSEKSKEFAQANAANLLIVLLEDSPGALAEAHDFCNHPDLASKFYILVPDEYRNGYSSQGALKDLDEGYGGVYWYKKGEIEACTVLEMAARRVEARRNIEYRHRNHGENG